MTKRLILTTGHSETLLGVRVGHSRNSLVSVGARGSQGSPHERSGLRFRLAKLGRKVDPMRIGGPSMSEMERKIREERERLHRQATTASAWDGSPFTATDPIINIPQGPLASFVADLMPLIPRSLWQTGWVGQSPDGLTRVAKNRTRSQGDSDIGYFAFGRQAKQSSRCKFYFVYDPNYGRRFVVLKDGRVGYEGNLDEWRTVIAQAIASRQKFAERLIRGQY